MKEKYKQHQRLCIDSCSMVRKSDPWDIYYGIPASLHGSRKRNLLKYVQSIDKGDHTTYHPFKAVTLLF